MTTSVLPLPAFFKFRSLRCLIAFNAWRSLHDKFCFGLAIFISAICCLTSLR